MIDLSEGIISNQYPPELRLRKRSEFLRLRYTTKKYAGRGILVVWDYNDAGFARIGITVSKKIGCAVIRNRIKRYIREYFRCNRSNLPAVDINVIARTGSVCMTFQKISQELCKSFDSLCVSLCSQKQHFF